MTNKTHTWRRNLVTWADTPMRKISLFFTTKCWQVWYDIVPFPAITALTPLGGFPQGLGVFMGIFDHSSRSTFVRTHTDVGREGLALSFHSNSARRCSVRLRSGLCVGQSSSSTPNPLLMSLWTCFVHWCTVMLGYCSHKVGNMEMSIISWYAEAFRVPLTRTKRPSPAPEEQPHTIIPLHQTLHLAQCSQTSTVLLANTRPRLIHQIARWRRAICHSRERLHCSRVQWQRALHHCIQHFALHLLMSGLDATARPWKPIPWSSLHCSWINLKAAWSLEVCSDWLCRKLATSAHYEPQHPLTRSVILCGRPLLGWVAVVPNRFHFVTIPLTVDCGIFRSEDISWLDLLHRWHPITVPCWS